MSILCVTTFVGSGIAWARRPRTGRGDRPGVHQGADRRAGLPRAAADVLEALDGMAEALMGMRSALHDPPQSVG